MKNRVKYILIISGMALLFTACEKEEKEKSLNCTVAIECSTILNNMEKLVSEKKEIIPKNGIILSQTTVQFAPGESVFDILKRVCREEKILMESSFTAGTTDAYIEGISNIYEFDCGALSGWRYSVNGEFSGISSSEYEVKEGDIIEWKYTCDMGADLGNELSME